MLFQILRRFWWVILMLLISPITNTFAQSGAPTAVATATAAQGDRSQTMLTIIVSDQDLFSPELIESLTGSLLEAGYHLNILTEADYAADPEARSSEFRPALYFFEDGTGGVRMELLNHPLRERSPILIDLPEPVQLTGEMRDQVETVLWYALYAVGECVGASEKVPLSMFSFDDGEKREEGEADAVSATPTPLTATAQTYAFDPLPYRLHFSFFYLSQCQRLDGVSVIWPPVFDEDEISSHIAIADTVYYIWNDIRSGAEESAFRQLDALAQYWQEDALATVAILRKGSQFHALANDFDSAMQAIQQAIDLAESAEDFPAAKLAALYIQRGQVNMLLYEWDAAIADYTTAIQTAPGDLGAAEAYYYRGIAYYSTLVDRERALPDFERYLEQALFGEHRSEALQYQADIRAELDALTK